MKSKEFEGFIAKTSKIVERALNNAGDVMGVFWGDDEEDEEQKGVVKGERIQSLFTFQDGDPLKRAITSIDWSPKVRILYM